METGFVKFKNSMKKYGFVTCTESDNFKIGEDFYFNLNDIGSIKFQALEPNEKVFFSVSQQPQPDNKHKKIERLEKKPFHILAMNKDITFSPEQITNIFGELDAFNDEEEWFKANFMKTHVYDNIHNALPIRVLLAQKGVGKSAVLRMSQLENQEKGIATLLINPSEIANLGNAEDFHGKSELIKRWTEGIELKLIEELTNDNGFNRFFKWIIETIPKGQQYVSLSAFDAKIKHNKKNLVLYIDDLDVVWSHENPEKSISIVSALLNAIQYLHMKYRWLHFRISMRSYIYLMIQTSDESTDKIRGNVVWLEWTEREILALLTRRIHHYLFTNKLSEKMLMEMTAAKMSTECLNHIIAPYFRQYKGKNPKDRNTYHVILSLVRRRPRDLIELCIKAAQNANRNNNYLITAEDWKDAFTAFSSSIVQSTIAEYSGELRDIGRLIKGMTLSNNETKSPDNPFIYKKDKLINKIERIINNGEFVLPNNKIANPDDLMHFMYKINFINAVKSNDSAYIDRKYFDAKNYLTADLTSHGYDWEIHPAFWGALYPKNPENLLVYFLKFIRVV